MADIINLRKARKEKERVAREAAAASNRAKHGRTKVEKAREDALRTKQNATLDQVKREEP